MELFISFFIDFPAILLAIGPSLAAGNILPANSNPVEQSEALTRGFFGKLKKLVVNHLFSASAT